MISVETSFLINPPSVQCSVLRETTILPCLDVYAFVVFVSRVWGARLLWAKSFPK